MEEQEIIQETNTNSDSPLFKVLAFFAIAVLAIVAFSLGNSFVFFTIAGVVLLVVSIFVTRREIHKEGISTFAFFLFPIFVYGILSGLSYVRLDDYFNLPQWAVFIISIGLAAFSAIGYFMSIVKEFKIKYALIVVYSAIAAYTLINLLATEIDFGFFHTIIYKGKYLFYDGSISDIPINDMAMGLMGFKFSEISIRYFSMFPSMLVSAFIPLCFMKFKEDKKLFFIYLAFGLLGVISLVLMPNVWTLLTDVLILIVLVFVFLGTKRFLPSKVIKWLAIVIGSIIAIGIIVVAINAQSSLDIGLKTIIKENPILNKLFNTNRFITPINCALDGLITTDRLLGTPINILTYTYPHGLLVTGSWLFDGIYTSGVFGLFFLCFVIVVGIRRTIMYFNNSSDDIKDKATILGFVLTFFAYTLINFDVTPFVFSKTVIPMYENALFLITIFFMSYCYSKSEKPKDTTEETINNLLNEEKEEIIDEEISL